MDSLDQYRQIILQVLSDYAAFASQGSSPQGTYEYEVIVDQAATHYLVILQGWEGRRRIHACIIHIDIIDGKIWIQHDGTEDGVGQELLNAGVPKDKIVLGFKSPTLRKYTEFAAA